MNVPIDIFNTLADELRDIVRTEIATTPHTVAGRTYRGHVASERLLSSVRFEVYKTLQDVTLEGTMLYYGKFVADGRPTGRKGVPIEALVKWIRDKKINLNGKRAESVAWAMQSSIRRRGIPSSRYLDDSLKKSEPAISKAADRFVQALAQQVLHDLAKSFDYGHTS